MNKYTVLLKDNTSPVIVLAATLAGAMTWAYWQYGTWRIAYVRPATDDELDWNQMQGGFVYEAKTIEAG